MCQKASKESPFEELTQLGSMYLWELNVMSAAPEAILDHTGLSVSVSTTGQEDRGKPGSSVTMEQTSQPVYHHSTKQGASRPSVQNQPDWVKSQL